MVIVQVELITQLALDLLTQTIMGHHADKVRAQLRGALVDARNLGAGFGLGLKGVFHQESKHIGVGYLGGMHSVGDDCVGPPHEGKTSAESP